MNLTTAVRNMREYILTVRERKAIEKFLKDEKPTNLIYVLRHRTTKSLKRLDEDITLLQRLVKRHRSGKQDE